METTWGPQGCGDHVETTWGQHEDNVETTWRQCGDHRDVETTWGHEHVETIWDNMGTTGMWRPHGDNMETTWGPRGCGDHVKINDLLRHPHLCVGQHGGQCGDF